MPLPFSHYLKPPYYYCFHFSGTGRLPLPQTHQVHKQLSTQAFHIIVPFVLKEGRSLLVKGAFNPNACDNILNQSEKATVRGEKSWLSISERTSARLTMVAY